MVDFIYLANLLRARVGIIAAVVVVTFLAGVAYVLWSPKLYESRAVIQVLQEPQKVVNIADISEDKPDTTDYLNTVVQAFTSRKLMLRVIQSAGLDRDPAFAPPKKNGLPHTDLELASRMLQKVKVSLRRGTRLVDVTMFDENPEMAKTLASVLVNEFLRDTFERRRALSQGANAFLQEEAQELKAKLERAERKLQAYREENQAVSLEERQDVIIERLRELNTAVTEAKNSRLRIEADLDQLKGIGPDDLEKLLRISSVSKIPQVAFVREQLLKAENQFAMLKERYLPLHPRYIVAGRRIAKLRESLGDTLSKAADTIGREYEALRETEAKLAQSLQDQEQKAMELNRIAIPYNVLQRDVESDRALFESVTLRQKETHITGGIDNPPFRIIEEPLAASSPSKPRKKLILALALALGATLGIGLVIGSDAIDSSLRTLDEAESYIGIPLLAAIPDRRNAEFMDAARKMVSECDFSTASAAAISECLLHNKPLRPVNGISPAAKRKRKNELHRLVLVDSPGSEQAEAFRTLRASLSLLDEETQYRSFLFTSAIPSEGKTFTSLNFAISLAQHHLKTVIIDADMREPSLNRVLLKNGGNSPGLSDLLSRRISLSEALTPTEHNNLVLLSAGHRALDPAELLDNKEFGSIIDRLLLDFDRVVVDSPPVNAVSDALLVAAFVQVTCLVVQAGKTPKKQILRALHQLEKARAMIVGFIFNRLPIGDASAGYYYYRYGARYAKADALTKSEDQVSPTSSAR